ncbi:MAG: DNA primase [Candidatus Aenigmarchaeota archaeon]|nr:DNA primase [Candidatus Aenigmarchaeota archaeon]
MGKIAENAKYLMKFSLEADSLVERPDVIGAIFGQTEGLLGQGMELKELQESGRVGRIEIIFQESKDGKTRAEIVIPSNLSIKETVLLAASVETVDKVGFTSAKIQLKDIEDVRSSKRSYIESRSKELLSRAYGQLVDPKEALEKLDKDVKIAEAIEYKGLCAGPEIHNSREIVIVEGRADVINLLKYGIRNAIAIDGSKVSENVSDIVKDRITTVFLDGDRGGDMILKRLKQFLKVDYVARAPDGKEVEELTGKEIRQALKTKKREDKAPPPEMGGDKKGFSKKAAPELPEDLKARIGPILKDMLGTKEVRFLDSSLEEVHRASYGELSKLLKVVDFDNVAVVLMDGKFTKDLAERFEKKNIQAVACFDRERFKTKINVLCIDEF